MTNLWTLGEFSRHGHMVLWPSVILAGFSFHQPWSLMYRTNVEEIESFTNFKTPPLFTFGQFPSAALNVGFSPLCQFLKLPSLCHVSFPLKKKLADGGPGDRLKSQALSGATGLEPFLFFDGSFLDGVEGRDVAGLWRRECPKCSLDFLFFWGDQVTSSLTRRSAPIMKLQFGMVTGNPVQRCMLCTYAYAYWILPIIHMLLTLDILTSCLGFIGNHGRFILPSLCIEVFNAVQSLGYKALTLVFGCLIQVDL